MPKSYQDIASGPFCEHSEDAPQIEISTGEARTILENWVEVATYNLPRKHVAEMMEYQAAILKG